MDGSVWAEEARAARRVSALVTLLAPQYVLGSIHIAKGEKVKVIDDVRAPHTRRHDSATPLAAETTSKRRWEK